MKAILSIPLLLCMVAFVQAQTEPQEAPRLHRHVLGLSCGVNQIKEENLIPLVHSGLLIEAAYEFRRAGHHLQLFQLSGGFSRLKTKMEDLSASANATLNLSYAYCFRLLTRNKFVQWAGPTAAVDYSLAFFPNWDESHLYWADNISIGIRGVTAYFTPRERTVILSLTIPLVSVFSRPELVRPYKIDDISFGGILNSLNSDMTFGLWNRSFRCHVGAEYQFPVFKTKLEAISYDVDFTWIKKDSGRPFKQLTHTIGLRILL